MMLLYSYTIFHFFAVKLLSNWLFGRLGGGVFFLELISWIFLAPSSCLEGQQSPVWSNRETNLWRGRESTSKWLYGRCLPDLQPTVLHKEGQLLPRFFLWCKENSQLMLTSLCDMKDIMSMTCKGYKHNRARCFPRVPKTAELTPRLYCSLFNSENKFMGDQPSSHIQFLTATIFSKYPTCFLVTEHFILLSIKAPSVSEGARLIKETL